MALLIRDKTQRALLIAGVIGLLSAPLIRAGDTILLLKSRDLAQYNVAAKGFLEAWKTNPSTPEVREFNLSGSPDELNTLRALTSERPLAIVTVGTEATAWAITNSTAPVVFCMVANAQQSVMAGLLSGDKTRVHGVSLDIPARTQLRRMLGVLPKVKRVGVLYHPKKSAAAVGEMKQAAAELGLEVIGQEIDSQSSLPEATALIVPRIDLLWAPVDSTVFNSRSAQFVLTQMLQSKVPVMGFSENMVKAGALLAPRVNYEAVGRQTAELLRDVLHPGGQLGEPVQPPQDFQIVVNGRVLELLGNPIPQAAIGQVSVINNEE